MAEIVPTITTADPNTYKAEMIKINSYTNRVQIDVSDGMFAPIQLIAINQVWWPEGWMADLHMMVAQPSLYMDMLLAMKPNMVVFHAEVQEELSPIMAVLRKSGIKAGVAFLKPTYPGKYRNLLGAVDHAMIFSGDLGRQGGKADMMQLEKVRIIKKIKPTIEIGWDGGINMTNASAIAQGGVGVLNVGSALSGAENPAEAYAALKQEIAKKTVI